MTQILGNLSKNIANPSIRSMFTSSICSVPPFVHPSFPLSVQSISVRLFSPSICSVRPSVRLATLSTPSVHSVLSVPLCSPFVPPSICLSVHPLCPSIQTVQFVCLFSPSICSSVRPFVRPVCLSVQSVCPSTVRMATRTAKNQYVKISKTAVLHVHRAFRTFLCRWCTTSTWNFHIPCIFHFT